MPFFRAMKNAQPLECRVPESGTRQLPDPPRTGCRATQSSGRYFELNDYREEAGGPRTESLERETDIKMRSGRDTVATRTGTRTGGGVKECNPALAA